MAAPVSLFPTPTLAFEATANGKLQAAIDRQVQALQRAGRAPQFSLAVIDLGDGSASATLGWGAHKPDAMHYVASAVKVAAMLAAHGLLDMANRYATAGLLAKAVVSGMTSGVGMAAWFGLAAAAAKQKPEPALFKRLRRDMDPAIDAAAPTQLETVTRAQRVPSYESVLAPPPKDSGFVPGFTGAYRNALRDMIVPSSNEGAGTCIRGVSYGYLNGLLAAAGLFKGGKGVWLAGDFVGRWPYVRIESENDAGVAQAGTALAMAKMMALIVNDGIIGKSACEPMRALLAKAVTGPDQPFLTRDLGDATLQIPIAKVTHAKLGFGPLKKGGNVCSEIFRLQGFRNASKSYAVAFQNLNENVSPLSDVSFMLIGAIEGYEA